MIEYKNLGGRLRAIQQRMRWRLVTAWLARALCAGLAVSLIALLANRLGLVGEINIAVLAVFAAVIAVAISAAFELLPTLDDAARLADQSLAAREQFSTAQEAGSRLDPNLVERALLDVADSQSAQLNANIVPLRLVPRVLPVAVLAAALALVAWLVPEPLPAPEIVAQVSQPTVGEDLEGEEQLQVAEDVQRLANLLSSQAESRNDEYSMAIARTLEALGERLASGETMNRSEVAAELESLRDYAIAATSDWRGTVGERLPELIDALAEKVALPPQMEAAQMMPNTPEAVGDAPKQQPSGSETGQQSGESGPSAPPPAGARPDFDSLMADAEERLGGRLEDPDTWNYENFENPAVTQGYLEAAKAQNEAELAMRSSELGQDAQVIGPSSDSEAGDSMLAGDGTEQIGGAELFGSQLEFETSDEMNLAANDTGEGQRIEKEIEPPSQLTVVADPTDRSGMESWERRDETAASRSTVPTADRERVSAYRLGLREVDEP
jgi:hypothetical protein